MYKSASEEAAAARQAKEGRINDEKNSSSNGKKPSSTLPKKRKPSHDSKDSTTSSKAPSIEQRRTRLLSLGSIGDAVALGGGGGGGDAASQTSEDTWTMGVRAFDASSSLSPARPPPPKKRKASFDSSLDDLSIRRRLASIDSSSDATSRRRASLGSWDDAALGLAPLGSLAGSNDESATAIVLPPLKPLPPIDTTSLSKNNNHNNSTSALDHLDALGDDAVSLQSKREDKRSKEGKDDNSSSSATITSRNQRLLMEALMMTSGPANSAKRRDRIESWGGMSDLSVTGLNSDPSSTLMDGAAAAALAASALQQTGIIEDVTKAANSCNGSVASSVSSSADKGRIPSRISLRPDRKYSIASLSDDRSLSVGEVDPDIQAFVAAAMASVEGQLAELAGAVETIATSAASMTSDIVPKGDESDLSSANSLLLSDLETGSRPRSWSISSKPISVDYDAVAAAVDAAEAASGALGLSSIGSSAKPDKRNSSKRSQRRLPLMKHRKRGTNGIPPYPPIPASSKSEKDMEEIRAKARAAAGYIPPAAALQDEQSNRQPLKKRNRRADSISSETRVRSFKTPAKKKVARPDQTPSSKTTVNTPASAVSHGSKAASQKWDEMFDCLIEFIENRRETDTKGLSEKEKNGWVWDGNVPTTYKTKDGKALGRWINNQRSAKNKGNLKVDREQKLVSTGLKWSVLATNPWQDMMEELRIYVREKTKDGKAWDGNVPTNYRIKCSNGATGDEDKNLGRWINRQRTLYQTGKLRQDRRAQLEKIGLKWSVLSTTSWDDMYMTLLQYVKERNASDGKNAWDGNVPANHKTSDNPPRALGRWINRQRSNYMKGKLKQEYVDKLNSIGLRWCVHERKVVGSSPPALVTSSSSPAPVTLSSDVATPSTPATTRTTTTTTDTNQTIQREQEVQEV